MELVSIEGSHFAHLCEATRLLHKVWVYGALDERRLPIYRIGHTFKGSPTAVHPGQLSLPHGSSER